MTGAELIYIGLTRVLDKNAVIARTLSFLVDSPYGFSSVDRLSGKQDFIHGDSGFPKVSIQKEKK